MRITRAFLFAILLFSASPSFAEPLRIGFVGSLTGDAASIGTEIRRTLESEIRLLNSRGGMGGRKIELLVEDDGYDVQRGLTAYEAIRPRVNSKVIFMSTYGAVFALGRRPERDGMVIVDTLDCNDRIVAVSANHTCVATRTESIGAVFLEGIARAGGGRVAILSEDEPWFNFISDTVVTGSSTPVLRVTAPSGTGDYRAELLRIRAAEARHIVFLGNDAMGRALAQARELGITSQFYSIAGVMSPGFRALAGETLEGAVISNWTAPESPLTNALSDQLRLFDGEGIHLAFVAGPTADGVRLVFHALSQVTKEGLDQDPDARFLRRAMSHIRFDGVTGPLAMDSDGAVRIPERAFVFRAGELH